MKLTCPSCGAEYPIEAGLLEDDGKRLAALVGELEPLLARAALAYLRLFKPSKTALRTVRAIKILHELHDLVELNEVVRALHVIAAPRTPSVSAAPGLQFCHPGRSLGFIT